MNDFVKNWVLPTSYYKMDLPDQLLTISMMQSKLLNWDRIILFGVSVLPKNFQEKLALKYLLLLLL